MFTSSIVAALVGAFAMSSVSAQNPACDSGNSFVTMPEGFDCSQCAELCAAQSTCGGYTCTETDDERFCGLLIPEGCAYNENNNAACRTSDNGRGDKGVDYTKVYCSSEAECEELCCDDANCQAYEFESTKGGCELWSTVPTRFAYAGSSVCNVKVGAVAPPVAPPTRAPVAPPTRAPVAPPTRAPVAPPTRAPVAPPTRAPVAPPTRAPVAPPCADTYTCPPGFTATNNCPLDQSDCVCNGSFSCPANSSPKIDCPQSFADCKCDQGFTKEGGQCVEVCNDPQPETPYSCHLFGSLLYPGGSYLGNFEVKSPSLQFRTTEKRYRTYVQVDAALFGTSSFELRYLSESKCAKSGWVVCKNSTPIGLDINNSGAVERIEGKFEIDLSGDGHIELLQEWFAPTEGILISTTPAIKNGHVTGQNLFGDMGHKYEDGFAKLSVLDTNADTLISGAELDGIAIWVDANSNALLDEGELFSLETYNIVGLHTDDDEQYASSAILSDGTEMYMEDLWFTEDMSYTRRGRRSI